MTEDDPAPTPDGNGRADADQTAADALSVFARELDIYRAVTEEDYQAVLTAGLVVLDTNALLNLYRYHAKTRDELIGVLRGLRDRVWVPYHAIFEFFEKRLSVINSRNDELRQAVEGVGKSGSNIDQAFRTWANRVGLSQEQVGDIVEGAGVRVAIISLIEQIREVGADNAFETRATQPKIP